jgi:hypothetical protein
MSDLARVVDQRNGATERALQFAQIGEQWRDHGGGVLVDAVVEAGHIQLALA